MLFLWGCVSHDHPFPIGGAVPWGMPRQAERNPGSHLSGSRTRLAPPTATQRRSRQSALALTFPNHSITMGRDPASKARQGNIACRFGVSMPGFSRRNAAGKVCPDEPAWGRAPAFAVQTDIAARWCRAFTRPEPAVQTGRAAAVSAARMRSLCKRYQVHQTICFRSSAG